MKRTAFFAFILSFLTFISQAQDYYSKPDSSLQQPVVARPKPQFGLQMGTSVGFSRYGTSFNSFIAPSVSYQVSPRWTIQAGVGLANYRTPSFSTTSENRNASFYGGNTQQTFFYAQGRYQVSDRLTVSGTATHTINQFGQSANNRNLNFNSNSMSVYAEYKISEHFSFGVGGQISNGNTPYRYQPFGRSMMGSSFYPGSTNYMGW